MHLLCVPDTDDAKLKNKNHETIPSRYFPEQRTKKSLFYDIRVKENLSSLPWKDFVKLFFWVCSGCCNSTFFKQPLGQYNNLSFNKTTINNNKTHLDSHFLVIQEERKYRKLYQTNLTWPNPFFLTFRKDVALEENQLDRRTCWLFGQWGDTRQYFVLCSESFRFVWSTYIKSKSSLALIVWTSATTKQTQNQS